jgi:predicted Zn-ribbon and HTH transcriptional regulator
LYATEAGNWTVHWTEIRDLQFGTHFEIEVKSDKGKPTAAQLAWLNRVAKNNGIAVLIHPERNDPIGLRERVLKMLIGQKCPQCVSKSSFERKDWAMDSVGCKREFKSRLLWCNGCTLFTRSFVENFLCAHNGTFGHVDHRRRL